MPKQVRFYRDVAHMWCWSLESPNHAEIARGGAWRDKADMLHNLALVHGRQISEGDTTINPRQYSTWRWLVDTALYDIGLTPYADTYKKD